MFRGVIFEDSNDNIKLDNGEKGIPGVLVSNGKEVVQTDENGRYSLPQSDDIVSSIKQTVEFQLNPPIKNIGIKGLHYTSKAILNWPKIFNDTELKMNLFTLYIFFEIGGTGGGCFRYMYSRFLKEAMEITKNKNLNEASKAFSESGSKFTEIGLLFKEVQTMNNINEKIKYASQIFSEIAIIEEKAFILLKESI